MVRSPERSMSRAVITVTVDVDRVSRSSRRDAVMTRTCNNSSSDRSMTPGLLVACPADCAHAGRTLHAAHISVTKTAHRAMARFPVSTTLLSLALRNENDLGTQKDGVRP